MKKSTYFLSLFLTALFCLPWSSVAKADPIEITPENPYTNSFDTETTNAVPTGWTKVAGNTYNPGIDSKNDWSGYTRNSSAKALFFMGYLATGDEIVALPQFSADIKTLTVDFYYKTKSSSYPANMSVGYITNLSDKSTYVAKSALSYSSSGWTHFSYTFDENTPDGAYIAISFAGTNSSSSKKGLLSVEDITVTTSSAPVVTCAKPKALAPSFVNANEATFNWEQGADETAYQYACVAQGVTPASWTDVAGTERTLTLNGLTPVTTYDLYVRSNCGEEQSNAVKVTFQTPCGAVALPFNWDFSTLGCWTTFDCHSSTGISSGAFRFYYSTTPPQYLISPELLSVDKQITVEFDYWNQSASYEESFQVGYSTTTNDVAAFTWGEEVKYKSTSHETYSEIFPAGVKYIAIKYTSYDKYYLFIDNFSVTEYVAPSCAAPTALTVTDITTNSASVSWTSEAAAFALEYKKTSDADWTAATGTITSPFALEGLTANETEYTVRVKAICGENNESEWTELAAPFKTECTTQTVTEETAWTEDFEAMTADQAPACWYLPTANDSYYYAKVIASEAKESAQCLDIKTYGTSSEIIVLPEFNEPVEHLNISFDYKNINTGSNYGQLEVGYYSGSSFTRVGEALSKVASYTASGVIEMPKTGVPDGARIAFRVVGKKSGYNSHAYIDNLSVIRKPACAVPTNLQAVATSTGATLTWSAGDEETQWNVRYREIAEPENVWTLVENVATGYAITDLLVDHNYEVQVQAYCDATHQSAWTASTNFTPVCGAAPTDLAVSARSTNAATLTWEGTESAFKLQTSFDGETWSNAVDVNAKTYDLTSLTAGTTYYVRVQNACGGEYATTSFTTWCGVKEATELPLNIESFTVVPECWEINFVGEYSGFSNNKIFFYGDAEQMAVLPAYDIELNKLSVTFGFSTTASLEFGYLDEPNGAFHAFATQPTTGVELNLENEAAAVKYIAIRYTSTNAYASGSISSVLLRKTPTCAKPVDVTATPSVGAASIDWTSEATAWNLQYKLASAADWTDVAVTAKPFEITSLAQGATYKVRAQANCGDELSDWSDEVLFTTNCSGIEAIPYEADFSVALSACWGIFAQDETYYKPAANTAMQQLTMNGGKDGASNNVVVMPPFSADLSKAVINFEYSCSTGANYAQLEVGYVTDKADAATFQALQTLDRTSTWTETRVATATVPVDAYIAFRYAGGTSHGDLAIRNLRVIKDATLVDSEDNEAALGALIGETVDVTINRTLTEGYYNTLCLPFDLATLDGTPLEGSELWGFKYGYVENGELLIRIVETQQIEAGVPYLIIVPSTVVTPTFKDVVIRENIGKSVGETEEVKFVGILKPEAFSTSGDDVHKKLFLLPDNKLAWAGVANSLKSFRAYFRTTENVSGQPVAGIPARILREPSIATGCENVQDAVMSIKVLENNQVVIIRNGVKYNLQGQIIEKF